MTIKEHGVFSQRLGFKSWPHYTKTTQANYLNSVSSSVKGKTKNDPADSLNTLNEIKCITMAGVFFTSSNVVAIVLFNC